MSGNSADGDAYGRREDEAGSYATVIDEEAQPLQTESFELDNFSLEATPGPQRDKSHNLQRLSTQIQDIIGGRHQPRIQKINPLLPSIQAYPVTWLEERCPSRRLKLACLSLFCFGWAPCVAIVLHLSTAAGVILVRGIEQPIQHIDCVDTFWHKDNGCGLDGVGCRPFNGTSFAFRCPASCATVQVLNPRTVGSQDIVYRPLVIGGPIYRGDSFICGSAIHAGIIKDLDGGCGIVSRVGQRDNFPATQQNGIESVEIDSYFPLSFEFTRAECKGKDPRWFLLVISLVFTITLSLFTTSPSLQFFITFTSLFAHVSLISDPSGISNRSISVLPEFFSNFVGRLLPAAFCAVVLYWTCVKHSLEGLTTGTQFEKTVLWVGGCWIGALNNYTFDWIPLQRLTGHDLEQQPSAKLSLAIIVVILNMIVVQQVYYFRLERRLLKYLALYGLHQLANSVVTLLQGLLLGLFINGVARWGFDSVLQTSRALRGDAELGSLFPTMLEPGISIGSAVSNISFSWSAPPQMLGYDGISVLVNDVERYKSYFGEILPAADHFTWERNSSLALPEYIRFGYLSVSRSLDYTKAGIWSSNGNWSPMQPP